MEIRKKEQPSRLGGFKKNIGTSLSAILIKSVFLSQNLQKTILEPQLDNLPFFYFKPHQTTIFIYHLSCLIVSFFWHFFQKSCPHYSLPSHFSIFGPSDPSCPENGKRGWKTCLHFQISVPFFQKADSLDVLLGGTKKFQARLKKVWWYLLFGQYYAAMPNTMPQSCKIVQWSIIIIIQGGLKWVETQASKAHCLHNGALRIVIFHLLRDQD